jgi:hypothetical protein
MLYTDYANMKKGASPATIHILYVSESFIFTFLQAFRYFY